jgi:hypothetical protein
MTKRERQDLVREIGELREEVNGKDKDQLRRQMHFYVQRLSDLNFRACMENLTLEPYASDIQDKLNRAKRR